MSLLAPHQEGPGLQLSLAGVPVRLEWTFLVWTAILGSTAGRLSLIVAWVVVVTVSILVHELGHAAALAAWGVRSRIVLHVMGGVTIHRADLPHRWSRIAVSLAGPAAGMLLLGLPALLVDRAWSAPDPWDAILVLAVWVNIGWAMVNLLPVLPLDGGNVAYELIDAGTQGRGEVPARYLSVVVAAVVGLWALREGFLFGGLFAGFFVIDNVRSLRGRRDQTAAADLRPAAQALETGSPATALTLAQGIADSARDPQLRAVALELVAWAHLAEGDRPAAIEALRAYPPEVEPNGHLRAFVTESDPAEAVNATVDAWLDHRYVPATVYTASLAGAGLVDTVTERLLASRADGAPAARLAFQHTLFVAGRVDESARLGERMVEAGHAEPIVAYNVACAHARAGRRDAALTWLHTAVGLGFTDRALLDQDPDLGTVRADPRFAMVRNRLPVA